MVKIFKKGKLRKLAVLILSLLVFSSLMFIILVSGQASFPSVNVSLINSTDTNASILFSNQQLFWYANYSNNITGRTEENSTFKWFINNTNQSGIGNRTAELKPMIYKDAVAYWHLDENGGTNGYADSSGFGNTGSPNGSAVNTTGIIKGGVSFNGTTDFINASGAASVFDQSGNYTFVAWFKQSDTSDANNMIVSFSNSTSGTPFVSLNLVSSLGRIELDHRNDSGSENFIDVAHTFDNSWHHVAATKSGTASPVMKIYVDGVERASVSGATPGLLGTTTLNTFSIGARITTTVSSHMNGSVDEVAIYNRSLSASEIKQLYLRTWYDYSPQLFLLHPDNATSFNTSDSEAPTTVSGAVFQPGKYVDNLSAVSAGAGGNVTGYWRFDAGGSTTTANDTSSLGHDGTFEGNVRWVNDSVGGLALQFDGTAGTFVNMSNRAGLSIANDLTVEAWIKPIMRGATLNVMGKGMTDATEEMIFSVTGNGGLYFDLGAALYTQTNAGKVENNTWQHIAGTRSSTTLKIYLNGVLQDVSASGGGAHLIDSASAFLVGAARGGTSLFNGTIDEVRLINRSLTAAEVLADYRAGAKGLGLLSNDYITYPITNNFNEREGTIEFWVKPEWDSNDGNSHVFVEIGRDSPLVEAFIIYRLSTNALRVRTANPSGSRMDYNISKWLANEWHHIGVTWNNYTSNMTFHIDGAQVNNSGTAFTLTPSNLISLGVAANAVAANRCNCTLSEFRISRKALTAQEINHSFSKSRQFFSNEYMLNGSNFNKGDALILEYLPTDSSATDGSKTNSSAVYIQNVASTVPVINTPTANSYNTTSTVTWTASTDFDGDTVTYRVYVNGTFNGSTTATSLTLNMTPELTYAVNVSAFDGTVDSGNSTQVQFVFDNLAPRLNNGSNSDNTSKFVNRNWAFLNFTFTEPFNATAYILNTSGSTTANTTPTISSGYFYRNFTNLTDGSYLFRGWMNDSAGNVVQTSQINITIDTTAPNITILTPEEGSEVSSELIITYILNDSSGISSCNTVSEVLGVITNGTVLNVSNNFSNNLLNSTGLAEGSGVAFQMRCTDIAGNAATSQARTFKIATTLPTPSGSSGPTITYEKINKEGCGSGKTAFEFGGATYCTSCSGVMTEAGDKVYCIEPTEATALQSVTSVVAKSGVPIGAIVALAAFAAAYILFFTNLIFKWKKGGKNG